jgi:membrane peptidoglycan carboxypeptidase
VTRLIRLIAVIAGAALLLTGTSVAFAMVGSNLAHHTASSQQIPLPPLADSTTLAPSTVYADDGKTVLAVLHASQLRKPIPLKQVAPIMIKALLDTEDHRFYLHGGFDIPSTIRALSHDSSSGNGLQGGSTITQQLVKLTYLTPERKLSRKIKEAVIADRLERTYSKDQILQAYLNTIYFGNGAYGIEAAAITYFNEHASQLTLPQAALLAGLVQNPSGYDPILQPADSRDRREQVLDRMAHYNDITAAEEAKANATPLPVKVTPVPTVNSDQISDYYVQEVETELLGANSPLGSTYDQRYQALFEGGLKIYTNLDPTLQSQAEQTIAADTPANSRGFQQAMVAIDPATGKVRAMVGGTGVNQSHYNIITQGTRQPGSGFKLFTLVAALEQNYSLYDTLDGQSPCAIDFPTDHDLVTQPAHNDEGDAGAGVMNLLDATALSINCAYIRLAHEVGLQNVISVAHSMGVTATLPEFPSIVIGSVAVHPIDMAAAYATVADNGVYHTPTFVDHIVDPSGATIYKGQDPGHPVMTPQVAEEATLALQGVVQFGTGTRAALYNRPSAGKTGTTDSVTDAWFNGFTPQLETTVWMGDESQELPMTNVGGVGQVYGGTFPAQTWHDFMTAALANQPVIDFTPPNYALFPPAHYITSPGLVAADVRDHNTVYTPPPPATTRPTTGTTKPGNTGNPTPTTAPPATSPTTKPGNSPPPRQHG